MTKDEIKQTYSMADILARYGMQPNRAGFCKCPFHPGDNTASLKIYKDSYYCFGCQRSGDIFSFVQEMDGVSFKDAFLSLGGTYEDKHKLSTAYALYHAEKVREQREEERRRLAEQKELNNMLIDIYRRFVKNSEPLSDVWCDCWNALQYQLYLHGELNGVPY